MTAAWWVVLPVNVFVAVYGGAWLAAFLAVPPLIGAALALGNLLTAVVMVAKERPRVRERVHAAAQHRSPYSSLMIVTAAFSFVEAAAFLLVSRATHWLQGGF